MRERLALNIMLLVGQAFRDSAATLTIADISDRLRIPSITLEPIVAGLEENGLLTSTEREVLLPGRDTALIGLGDILAVVRDYGDTGSISKPRWSPAVGEIGSQLDQAIAATVENKTSRGAARSGPAVTPRSGAGNSHFLNEYRAAANTAAHVLIIAYSDDALVKIAKIARDRDFVDRVLNLAILDPVADRTARVITGHTIDALPDQFVDQQARCPSPLSARAGLCRRPERAGFAYRLH